MNEELAAKAPEMAIIGDMFCNGCGCLALIGIAWAIAWAAVNIHKNR